MKTFFLKFNTTKDHVFLERQINNVADYLSKRYSLYMYDYKIGLVGNDFLIGVSTVRIILK